MQLNIIPDSCNPIDPFHVTLENGSPWLSQNTELNMWRSKSSFKVIQTEWKDEQPTGKDIIQLYSTESRARKERDKKIIEIQRKAKRKNDSGNSSLLAKGNTERRKNSQAKGRNATTKLPPIGSREKPRKGVRRWSKRSSLRDEEVQLLPDINSLTLNVDYYKERRSKDPSRDPRFQRLISSLLINKDYYGDLQRFAPPKREMSKRTRLGLGF